MSGSKQSSLYSRYKCGIEMVMELGNEAPLIWADRRASRYERGG